MTTTPVLQGSRLIGPDDPEWDRARSTFNLIDDLRPAGIAFPEDARAVAETITRARRLGLSVAVQSTGHNATAFGPLDRAMVVNTAYLDEVQIDVTARRVRVGGGVKWQRIVPALSELGLAGLHGSSPDVGIAGYSLGGGIGWLARKYGMQANAVTAVELVTADGELRRVDHDHEADLFWALRGGNGNFGVVTALEFSVVPVRELFAGALFYPIERTEDVLGTWASLLPMFPEAMTTWVSVIHFPPDPALPELVRGQSRVILMAAHLGDESECRALLEPFQRLVPLADTLHVQRPIGLAELAMDPVEPLPYRSTTALLDSVPDAVVSDLARIAGPGSPLALLQARHGGGALGRADATAGARATLPGEVVLYSLGVVPDPAEGEQVASALGEIDAAVEQARVGDYPNFVERPADASRFFDAPTWRRLQQVKREYDAGDLFLGNHHITGGE